MIKDPNSLLSAIEALALDNEPELKLAHMLNALSAIKQEIPSSAWVGIYLKTGGKLILGPFQGTPACESIRFDKGVVGACYSQRKTLVVPDVTKFQGYISCDPIAAQEVCVPMCVNGETVAVFDVDYPTGDPIADDAETLEKAAALLAKLL